MSLLLLQKRVKGETGRLVEMAARHRRFLLGALAVAVLFLFTAVVLKHGIPDRLVLMLDPFGPKVLLATLFCLSLAMLAARRFKVVASILQKLLAAAPNTSTWLLCVLAAVLGILPILIYWSGAGVLDPNYANNYHVIGGRVPWSDAASFLTAAHNLIFDGELCSGCYRRPLNASFLSARLLITGFDYGYALLLQGAIFGVACLFCAISVARTHGLAAGTATFAIVYSYGAYFLPTNMTETLGLTLGALAFSALWTGVSYNRFYAYTLGLWLFCLAQIARPGAVLIIVSLLAVGFLKFRDKTFSFKLVVMMGFAVVPGLLTDKLILLFYGDPSARSTVGNFSYLLYGTSVGGKGWIQVFKDYPELYSMNFDAAESFIYRKTLENIANQPGTFLQGLFRNIDFGAISLLRDFWNVVIGEIRFHLLYLLIIVPVYAVLSGYAQLNAKDVKNYLRMPRYENSAFFTLVLTGFVISLAFIYRDGGIRSISASIPFLASLLAIAFYPKQIYHVSGGDRGSDASARDARWLPAAHTLGPATLGGFIVVSALIGPALAHAIVPSPPAVERDCGPRQEKRVIALPAMAYANVSEHRPRLRVHESNENIDLWNKIAAPATIFFAYDAYTKTSFFGYASPGVAESGGRYVPVCTSEVGKGLWKVEPR